MIKTAIGYLGCGIGYFFSFISYILHGISYFPASISYIQQGIGYSLHYFYTQGIELYICITITTETVLFNIISALIAFIQHSHLPCTIQHSRLYSRQHFLKHKKTASTNFVETAVAMILFFCPTYCNGTFT